MELLRFFTAGNVDDGKSTLIGRLLFESDSISTDIIETLTRQSKLKNANQSLDLALLTDGLRAEREQGITIDVAYKYFSTNSRKFIIADTPGHIQYTRNMFTGASNTNLAIILIDARHGITEQTKRHSIIASILNIPNILVCVNKMDLVEFSETIFNTIKSDYQSFSKVLDLDNVSFIPTSALLGDNITKLSTNMTWYKDKPLLNFLETVNIHPQNKNENPRFQVQYIIRPQTKELPDYRGFAGKVLSGNFHCGQEVEILPSNQKTTIDKIEFNQQEIPNASSGSSVIFHLKDDIDITRGSTIVPIHQLPKTSKEFSAIICWMDNSEFITGQKIIVQHNSNRVLGIIKEIQYKIDIHTYDKIPSNGEIKLNDICKVIIKTAQPISYDSYAENKNTGAFILINENTNLTIAAGTLD